MNLLTIDLKVQTPLSRKQIRSWVKFYSRYPVKVEVEYANSLGWYTHDVEEGWIDKFSVERYPNSGLIDVGIWINGNELHALISDGWFADPGKIEWINSGPHCSLSLHFLHNVFYARVLRVLHKVGF